MQVELSYAELEILMRGLIEEIKLNRGAFPTYTYDVEQLYFKLRQHSRD